MYNPAVPERLGKQELQKYIDKLGGEVDSLKTGDTKAVQESVNRVQQDLKVLPDKKDDVKKAFDLFKK